MERPFILWTFVCVLFLLFTFTESFQSSYELQPLDSQQMTKDPHLTKKKGKKGHGSKAHQVQHHNSIDTDRDGNFIDDEQEDFERDYVGKYTEHYNTEPPRPLVSNNVSSSYYFLDQHSTPSVQTNEIQSPISKIPRFTRIFGGFLKSSKTKIEGRVYSTFNTNFCQFKEDLCK
jgi:hypothetical protein